MAGSLLIVIVSASAASRLYKPVYMQHDAVIYIATLQTLPFRVYESELRLVKFMQLDELHRSELQVLE
jgi:hypothetical protein